MNAETTTGATLFQAASDGDSELILKILSSGVDLDDPDPLGCTALLLAARHGHYNVMQLLISMGADIDKQDLTCINPFLLGCVTGNLKLVELMVDAGADFERLTRFGGNGITPASEKGFLEVVELLLARTDINVNHTNWVGWTPLIEAIILNDGGPRQQRIVQLLLEHGADPLMTDKYGATPRELALRKGYVDIANLLLAAGG